MRRLVVSLFAAVAVVALAGVAQGAELDPGGTFIDDDGKYYEPSIEAIYAGGITVGCTDRAQYCPEDPVIRSHMAAFLARALSLPPALDDHFVDDNGSTFEEAINRIAEAGITTGCNPPQNNRYCPDRPVSREEMATFMVRAFELADPDQWDRFVDDDSSVHQNNIDRLAHASITVGCNPPDNDEYCPRDPVTRGQMAVFLTRAMSDLVPNTPPPRPHTHLVSRYTTYHSCCAARVHNIHVIANQVDEWIVLPWEEFNLNQVTGLRTRSKGYVEAPVIVGGQLQMGMAGGTSQFGTTIYNAFFWGGYDEVVHKPHSRYISRYPLGIEATLGNFDPLNVRFVNDTWTPIIIRTRYTSTSITVELWGNNDGRTFVGSWLGGRRHSITRSGGPEARRVDGRVFGSSPGTVRIERWINGSLNDTWFWTYVD